MRTQTRNTEGDVPATFSSQTQVESELGTGSNGHLEIHTQSRQNGGDLPAEGATSGFSLPSSSSSASFSSSHGSDSSNDDPLSDFLPKSEPDGSRSPAPEPVSTPDLTTQTPGWSMVSSTPRNATGNLTSSEIFSQNIEFNNFSASPMISPPTQTMGQPPAYDPNRIPASIFASKPATPMEWSVASNDSLFSLHMGNNSFSRDHVIHLGKSGELAKLEERNNSPKPKPNYNVSETKHNELNNFSSGLPPLTGVASSDGKSANTKEAPPVVKEDPSKNSKAIAEENIENHDNKVSPAEQVNIPSAPSNVSDGKGLPPADKARTFSSPPRLSNESGQSNSSFAFPVLVNDAGSSVSPKAATEKPEEPKVQPQPEPPEATPKPAESSWFSCFACWPRCC